METVVFRSFYEKGFALPAGSFFRGLLFFYRLEVTHLKANSIVQIVIFIHLCKAFLGIAPHFNLWWALYHLRGYPSAARRNVVSNPVPCVPARTSRAPESRACWEELPTEEEMIQVNCLLDEIAGLSAQGLTGAVVALSYSKRLV